MALIMIAEDDATSLDLITIVVRKLGHTPLRFKDGRSARDFLRDNGDVIDLLVTDLMMPELDGHALLRSVRGNPGTAKLPVIVQSAYLGVKAIAEVMDEGASAVLHKPLEAAALRQYIQRHLTDPEQATS